MSKMVYFVTCFINLLLTVILPVFTFDVYWNVPSMVCKNKFGITFEPLLGKYGKLFNQKEKFQGGNITIFYENQLGLYPKVLPSGQLQNQGIPQRTNLQKHLQKARNDLEKAIPDQFFRGLGVIDWEAWRPAWDLNWHPLSIYREESSKYVKNKYPFVNRKLIHSIAKEQWEYSAKTLMLQTLLLAKKTRPLGRWCYYLFPDCYNYEGSAPKDFECSKKIQLQNDKLNWLWGASTALCPSVYLYKSHLKNYNFNQRVWKDNGRLKEALRVAHPKTKLYPYVNYFVDTELMPKEEFERIVAQVASVGCDGVVIWGASSSVAKLSRCQKLKSYVSNTIGPVIENVAKRQRVCAKMVCNGGGKCTWPKDTYVTAWKLFQTNAKMSFNARDIVCKCNNGFSGRYCQNRISFLSWF